MWISRIESNILKKGSPSKIKVFLMCPTQKTVFNNFKPKYNKFLIKRSSR